MKRFHVLKNLNENVLSPVKFCKESEPFYRFISKKT